MKKKIQWWKILWAVCWIITSIGLIVLFNTAWQQKNKKVCSEIRIDITGVEKHLFIDEKDVLELLNANGTLIGKSIHSLNLRKMETMVKENKWVKNAEMFLDNNQVLQINIEERQPVARVFGTDGNSFYLDTAAVILPLSNKLTARVPAFTGMVVQKTIDSALLYQIINMAKVIAADSFFSAQIAQIDIMPDKKFELVPLIGDHLVRFGDGTDLENKFKKLKAFYQSAWLEHGMNTYETLDIQYRNQVVGVRKGTAKAYSDSAAALNLIKNVDVKKQ